MARSGALLTEAQWQKIAPLPSQAAQTAQGWSSVDSESSSAGRDSVDSAERGSLAKTCRRNSRIPRPAGGGCETGRSGAFG